LQVQSTLDEFKHTWQSPRKCAEFRIRELLGISMDKDLKPAWIEWVKRNHPDKGGNNETFALYNAAWEEYNYER